MALIYRDGQIIRQDPNKKNKVLDLVRGLAAIAVATGHLRAMMFESYSNDLGPLAGIFYFLTGFGHQAVIIFFVLSGFFVSQSAMKHTPGKYAINRLSRLWVVIIPALLLTLLFDKTGLQYYPNMEAYQGKIPYLPSNPIGENLTSTTFWGNVFFLQSIEVDPFGSNSPLWSLTYEFWYYVLFPLLYFARKRPLLLVPALLIVIYLPVNISLYFSIWLMGYGALYLSKKIKRHKPFLWVGLLLTLVELTGTRAGLNAYLFNDYLLGLSFALFIVGTSKLKWEDSYNLSGPISKTSFTLYVVHFPFMLLLTSMTWERAPFSFFGFSLYFSFFVATVVYTCGVWFVFERNTQRVKRWLLQLFNLQKKTPPTPIDYLRDF